MSDCVKSIISAVDDNTINDAQATELLQRMENLAKARQASKNIRYDVALREVAGEMKAGSDSLILINKRNTLLSLSAFRAKLAELNAPGVLSGKKFKQDLIMVDRKARARSESYKARLVSFLVENDMVDPVEKGMHGLEMYKEMRNIEQGGTSPVTNVMGDKLFKLAEFYKKERDGRNTELRLFGAYFPDADKPYGFLQNWSTERVRALGGTGMDAGHKARAKAAFMDLVRTWNLHPETMQGRDPVKFWNEVFTNFYNGNSQKLPDSIDIDHFEGIHGSLANKVSQSRLIWFNDAESQYRAMSEIGSGHYFELMMREMEHNARSITLMQEWGPNWKNSQDLMKKTLTGLNDRRMAADSAKQMDELKKFDLEGYQRLLGGEADISVRPGLTRFIRNATSFIHFTKMGGATITSLPDAGMVRNQLAMNGMKNADIVTKQMENLSPSNPEHKRILKGLNLLPNWFMGGAQNRYGSTNGDGYVAGISRLMNKLNWFNKWNDIMQETMSSSLSWWLGQHHNIGHASLPAELRAKLEKFGINDLRWDAIRSIAASVDEIDPTFDIKGEKYVLLDQIDKITDGKLDAINLAEGRNATGPNRQRARIDLENRLAAYYSDETASALSTPTLHTRYIATGAGIQAGTIPREMLNLLMIFKSFTITTALRFGERANEAGIKNVWSAKDWAQHPSYLFSQARFLATMLFAGYVSLTAKDILEGKTRRQLWNDEKGMPNYDVFLQAASRGGGIGYWGDVLLGEYDSQYRNILNGAAGPVFGQASQVVSALSQARDDAMRGEDSKLGGQLANIAQGNIPLASLFYVKPILNAFVFWNLREALSPGTLRRMKEDTEGNKHQQFFIDPVEMGAIPVTSPADKIKALAE